MTLKDETRRMKKGLELAANLEQLHFHFSLSCIGEGNGNLLQYSCLKNPRDGGAWWAAVYGVAQSRTRLKRLSSSSSSRLEGKAKPRPVLGGGYWWVVRQVSQPDTGWVGLMKDFPGGSDGKKSDLPAIQET